MKKNTQHRAKTIVSAGLFEGVDSEYVNREGRVELNEMVCEWTNDEISTYFRLMSS